MGLALRGAYNRGEPWERLDSRASSLNSPPLLLLSASGFIGTVEGNVCFALHSESSRLVVKKVATQKQLLGRRHGLRGDPMLGEISRLGRSHA